MTNPEYRSISESEMMAIEMKGSNIFHAKSHIEDLKDAIEVLQEELDEFQAFVDGKTSKLPMVRYEKYPNG